MIKNAQQIRQSTDTLSILSEFIELAKKGSHYTALCPFHTEKTPSFVVDPRKNNYVCYGCGASGDGVSFLMDHEHLTFPEAIEHVAKVNHQEVEYENPKLRAEWIQRNKETAKRRESLQQVASAVQEWYYALTWEGTDYRDDELVEFAGRTYRYATLRTFGNFYAPLGAELTRQTQFQHDLLLELGLISNGQKGPYDYYRNRSMFPITDQQGRVRGWGGRKPKSDTNKKNPKYLNSAQSELYCKIELLYGLYQNRRGISRQDTAILVEGYTDVMTLHDLGIDYAVASCGTALSGAQVQLLKRYTDNVVILRDGDEAGQKAARYDVRLFVQQNIVPQVVILPKGEDPDSFGRRFGRDGLLAYIEAEAQDGILWTSMLDYDPDPFKLQKALDLAGQLISYLKSETLQSQYISALAKRDRFGSVKRELSKLVYDATETRLKTKSPLTQKQQEEVVNYGIYERGNRYFSGHNPEIQGQEVSNFVIDSKMLIIGASASQRVIDIRNEHGRQYSLILDSRALTSFNDFKFETERMGNFLFFGDAKDFMRIRRKIYENTADVFPLNTMGWNKSGFYVWGNGVSLDGGFLGVNEYGVVEVGDNKYFLPAFSKIGDQYQGDDGEDQYEFEKKFVFHGKQECIDIRTWSRLMYEVHGWNGAMAVAYICAALFYDIIFSKYQFFPLLNAFGPSGSGKTWLARSVMAMFGRGDQQDPFNLASGTPVAFKRRLAQVANAVIWFDEYSNDVDFRRIEALKGAYDGAGHQKGVATQDNRVVTTKIRSALMYIGQQQATKDIALLKRSITLNCKSGTNTLDRQRKSDELKRYEKTGQLTQLTQYLLEHRTLIQEKFADNFDTLKIHIHKELRERECHAEDRIVNNYTMPVAALSVLDEVFDFGFDTMEFLQFCIESILAQSNSIQEEDELAIFWRMVQYMVETPGNNQIRHFQDILVQERTNESLQNELNSKDRSDSIHKDFGSMTRLLYLRFSRIHPEYQQLHQRQRNKSGLDLGALQYYLQQSPAYVGKKRNKKFNPHRSYTCYVFRMDELPIDLPLSLEMTSEEVDAD